MTNNIVYEKQMPETRRTNAGFLSNNEAARDKQRTRNLVRGLLTSKELEERTRKLNSKPKPTNQATRSKVGK